MRIFKNLEKRKIISFQYDVAASKKSELSSSLDHHHHHKVPTKRKKKTKAKLWSIP